MLAYQPAQALARADGHRGFRHQNLIAVHVAGHVERRLLDEGEVGRAVILRRRADGEEYDERLLDRRAHVRREGETARGLVLRDYLVEPRLVDGNLAVVEARYLLRVHVHTRDGGSELCETGPRHESDVARPDYRYVHLA